MAIYSPLLNVNMLSILQSKKNCGSFILGHPLILWISIVSSKKLDDKWKLLQIYLLQKDENEDEIIQIQNQPTPSTKREKNCISLPMMWPKCLAILSVQINGEKIAPPKKTKEKGDVHFFAMVIYYEKFQLFCVVHLQNATYLLLKVHFMLLYWRYHHHHLSKPSLLQSTHTIVKGNLKWIQNGFHICHLKRLHCTQAIFNYCIVFLRRFFTAGIPWYQKIAIQCPRCKWPNFTPTS